MRDKRGRFTRIWNPVMRRVIEHKEDQSHRGHLAPGRWGKRWEYIWSDLLERAPYDEDMRIVIRNIPKLVSLMCPTLNGERRLRLIQNLQSIAHAKQREHEKLAIPVLVTKADRLEARRKARGEAKREARRNALKELKRLLRSK